MKRISLFVAALATVAVSHAVTRSSFLDGELHGVYWALSPDFFTYTVRLDPGATLVYDGVTYDVTDLHGAFVLDDDGDFTAAGVTQHGWDFLDNYSGKGGVAGWDTNPNAGMVPGAPPLTFTFSQITGVPETVGFHLRFGQIFLPSGDNTAYISPVPEPSSLVLLAAGLLGLVVLRRNRA
jgi:hypothetical protein